MCVAIVYICDRIWRKPASTHTMARLTSPPLDFYISELTIHGCIIAFVSLVCFTWGLFLRPVWRARVLFKWQWCQYTSTHLAGLKSPHDWPESLAIRLATICDIWNSNGPQVRPSSSVNFNMWKNLPLPWLPTTLAAKDSTYSMTQNSVRNRKKSMAWNNIRNTSWGLYTEGKRSAATESIDYIYSMLKG